MVLVEVLAQLSVHPIPETYIHQIEDFAFKHFRAQEAILDRSVCRCRVEEEEGRGCETGTNCTCTYYFVILA